MNLFASLYLEREPLLWGQLPAALVVWLQNAGGVAAFGVFLVLVAGYLQRDSRNRNFFNLPGNMQLGFAFAGYFCVATAILYGFLLLCWIAKLLNMNRAGAFLPRAHDSLPLTIGDLLLAGCGAIALFIALTPVVIDLVTRIKWRRIFAIARLSWKEAVRGRVVWVFGAMALVFLFADWFVPYKPEDQLRSYVRVVYWSMAPLFLLTAGLLGSFSIPNDVKNNSIHTIVTKPVEKFEIVLGRFLGYAALLTLGLFVLASVSLIYVLRGVNEEATRESFKARVPIYGQLHFAGTKNARSGESVGREWSYRSYITCPSRRQKDAPRQYAIWDFAAIPADVADRKEPLLYEFAFDIFRLSKGEEGKGVHCTFTFTDGGREPTELETLVETVKKDREDLEAEARKKRDEASKGKTAAEKEALEEQFRKDLQPIDGILLERHRIYQAKNIEVTDYHTLDFTIPPGVLKALIAASAQQKNADGPPLPAMRVFVSVDVAREMQMVGVAQPDFYLVAYEMPFWLNFLKGIVGMWCTHMLVLGVALTCSTYLSSVISFLGTMFLFLTGLNVEYLREVAEKRVDGGGPAESFIRITTGMPVAAKLEESPTTAVVHLTDDFFSWWVGRILNLLPDVNRHDLHQYVANGFDIGWFDVLMLDNFLPLAAYLIPWLVVAYYLMKYREIANPS